MIRGDGVSESYDGTGTRLSDCALLRVVQNVIANINPMLRLRNLLTVGNKNPLPLQNPSQCQNQRKLPHHKDQALYRNGAPLHYP